MTSNNVVKAFTELAPRYEETVDQELRRFWGLSYREFVDRLIEVVFIEEGDLVLDVATGTAFIPLNLVDRVGGRGQVVGLDITLAMLKRGRENIEAAGASSHIGLVCASAMKMPFVGGGFALVICGLGTHHMDVPQMLFEMKRVLKTGGKLVMVDAGASKIWKLPGIKAFLRIATFLYFLSTHSVARAWAEADAVSHVHTADEWRKILLGFGFTNVNITKLSSHRFWSPAPLVVRAVKNR